MGDKWDPYFTLDPSIGEIAKRLNALSLKQGPRGYPGPMGPTGPMPVESDYNSLHCFHVPSTKAGGSLQSSATNNISLGRNTFDNLTTGQNNIAIGNNILQNLTTGMANIGIGHNTLNLAQNVSGKIPSFNVGIGNQSLEKMKYGQFNTGIGSATLQFYENPKQNTAIGNGAMQGPTTITTEVEGNTAVGVYSLKMVQSKNNTALGAKTFMDVTTGKDNLAIGYGVGYHLKTGSNNTLIGYLAGDSIITSDSNIIIGYEANTTKNGTNQIVIGNHVVGKGDSTVVLGSKIIQKTYLRGKIYVTDPFDLDNVTLGDSTLAANTTGFKNIAIGRHALKKSKNIRGTIAIGDSVLAITTGSHRSVAIGVNAMQFSTGGMDNVGIGRNVLRHNNSNGNNNTALGAQSMEKNTSGQENTAVGIYALRENINGHYNVAVGSRALFNNNGEQNVAIGFQAGNIITTGEKNVIIGYNADTSATNGINQIVIGTSVTGQGDNTVTIGNNNIKQWLSSSDKKVDLGKTNKRFKKLHTDSVTVYTKMGIGTNNPDEALHVQSATSGQSVHIKCQSTHANKNFVQLGATFNDRNRIYSRKMNSNNEVDECALYIETGDEGATGGKPKGNIAMTFWPGGKVGINTGLDNDPQYRLKVVGAIRCDSLLIADSFILPSTKVQVGKYYNTLLLVTH